MYTLYKNERSFVYIDLETWDLETIPNQLAPDLETRRECS